MSEIERYGEPFDSKYKLFKEIGVPHSGMSQSHLTIREDLQEEELSVPVFFLDRKEQEHIAQTDTLNIDCLFSTPNGEELHHDGYGIIVSITEPTRKWKERVAYAYSIDFDWN